MNQTQRDFLIKQVGRTYRNQKDKLDAAKPKRPSLNNYLVAAVLDGSFQIHPIESIKAFIKQRVLQLGPDSAFIKRGDRYDPEDEKGKNVITIPAEQLFVLPLGYVDALATYDIVRAEWDAEMERIEGYKETIILKIQLGSPQVLAKLIEQVDNLADLNIINSSLLLTAPDKQLKA